MPAFEWVHVQLHQQKGMISLSPPTICNSAGKQQRNQHQPVTVRRTRSPWREKNQKWGADRLNAHRRNTLY
ncbi:hypothetical protein CI673_023145 (plasmid) [Escherichia coli]|nr:hypothetical protein CI673_023145 [Escherichia coli]